MVSMKSNLKDLRESRKWSLRDLEAITGIPISTLSEYERGIRTPWNDDIPKLKDAFGEPVHFFFNVSPVTRAKKGAA